MKIEGGGADLVQRFADLARIGVADGSQPNGLTLADEEFDIELLLENLDLTANSTLGQAELTRGQGHAAGPSGGLERRQYGGGGKEATRRLHTHSDSE